MEPKTPGLGELVKHLGGEFGFKRPAFCMDLLAWRQMESEEARITGEKKRLGSSMA